MKKVKGLLAMVMVAGLSLGILAACGGGTTTTAAAGETTKAGETTAAAADTGSKKIGYAINNMNDTFQTFVKDAAEAKAKELGYTLQVTDCNEDIIRQQDAVKAFITDGVAAVVVVPVDTSGMDPITTLCAEANIPVVYVNRNPFGLDESKVPAGAYFVGSKEYVAGELQAQQGVKDLEGVTGGYAVLQGILGNEGTTQRTQAVHDVLGKELPDLKMLAEQTGNWQKDQGLTITENWLTNYGDELKAVFANNDEMAIGASNALTSAGRDDVKVYGIDATADGVAAVKEGKLAATVFQDSKGQGGGAVQVAVEAAEGKGPSALTFIDYKLVTKDNADTFDK